MKSFFLVFACLIALLTSACGVRGKLQLPQEKTSTDATTPD